MISGQISVNELEIDFYDILNDNFHQDNLAIVVV